MSATSAELAAFVPQALSRARAQRPLVPCLTNTGVADFTANVLYAVGSAPAMVDVPDEAGLRRYRLCRRDRPRDAARRTANRCGRSDPGGRLRR